MPIDPLTISAIIAGGSSLIGTGANALSTGAQNRQSRAFSREMYARQRADNIEFWNMQNRYNDPKSAKARLKAAGLNPALLYGGSASGAAGVASSLDAPSAIRPEFQAADFSGIADAGRGVSAAIMAQYGRDIQVAQVENMAKQNALLDQQIKNAQIEANRKQFDLDLDVETRPTSVASREAQLRKLNADLQFTLDNNDRLNLQNVVSVAEGMERILIARLGRDYTRELLENAKVQRQLMQSDLKLRSQGLNYNDPLWMRILYREIEGLLPEVRSAAGNLFDFLAPPKPVFKRRNWRGGGVSGKW